MYSTPTATKAPKIATASFRALKWCSGLLSNTMVVEIWRKFPHTNAYRKIIPVSEITCESERWELINNPMGAASEKPSRYGIDRFLEPSWKASTVINAKAAGARCKAMPSKIAFWSYMVPIDSGWASIAPSRNA